MATSFILEMSTFFRKMTTSNEARDSVHDVDDVQTLSNIYDADDDGQSWSIITPYLGPKTTQFDKKYRYILFIMTKKRVLILICWKYSIKLWQIRVPIRGLSSRRFPNPLYLSQVKVWYWKPKIVVTRIPISSLIGICPNTNMLTIILFCVRTFLSQNTPISEFFE